MIIKEYQNENEAATLLNEVRNKNYAVFAIGGGAITSVQKAYENKILRQHITFYQCDSKPSFINDAFMSKQRAEAFLEKENILANTSFSKAIVISMLGGCTGTDAAPVFSKYLFEKGLEVINIVSLPFAFEGKIKLEKSQVAVSEMSKYAKTTIIFNEEIYKTMFADKKFGEFFAIIDENIENALFYILGIMDKKNP